MRHVRLTLFIDAISLSDLEVILSYMNVFPDAILINVKQRRKNAASNDYFGVAERASRKIARRGPVSDPWTRY